MKKFRIATIIILILVLSSVNILAFAANDKSVEEEKLVEDSTIIEVSPEPIDTTIATRASITLIYCWYKNFYSSSYNYVTLDASMQGVAYVEKVWIKARLWKWLPDNGTYQLLAYWIETSYSNQVSMHHTHWAPPNNKYKTSIYYYALYGSIQQYVCGFLTVYK